MALSQPDPEVLHRAQRGDHRAFSLIMRQYEGPIFNYVLRLVRNREVAEDLTQEVFFRVFQTLPSFNFRALFTTWLFQVTKNRVIDEVRLIERRPRSAGLESAPPLQAIEMPIERRETMDALWAAIGRLDLDLKMALLLRDVVGMSYLEISDALEITLATVKWRIYRAREEVQLTLASEGLIAEEPAIRARAAEG
jgi:RNA polymerase sigma-70 factor (ECF subfamily)